MNFDRYLTEDQRLIRDLARKVAEKEVAPRAAEADEREQFPHASVKALAEAGLFGLFIPKEFGGTDGDVLSLVVAIEEIARACASTAVIYATQAHCAYPILMGGSDDQKRRHLPPLARGERLGAICFTEPGAGTDVKSIATKAVKSRDGWRITGAKSFITNGDVAGTFSVFARTGDALSAFVVERGPWVSVTKVEKKLGLRGSTTAQLAFEEAPAELLGREGEGFLLALRFFDKSRPDIAAQAVGLAQAAYEAAARYVLERAQFGRPIAEYQAVQMKIGDMATAIAAARLLTYHAAATIDSGAARYSAESAMAKCFASDAAMGVAGDAVQLFGGYGCVRDFPVERYLRDAKITQIYEGTNDILRTVIARNVLKEAR